MKREIREYGERKGTKEELWRGKESMEQREGGDRADQGDEREEKGIWGEKNGAMDYGERRRKTRGLREKGHWGE